MKLRAGFSLVEVLCAILILAIGIVGLTEALTAALSSSKEAEVQTTAAFMASGQIEALRADGFVVAGDSEGEGDGALANYKWRQKVAETRTEGLFEVTVTVTHNGQDVYELATMLFDPPVSRDEKPNSRERDRERNRRRS